ncbi:MAG: hypothetical protein ACLFM1_02410 [Bacteroidales bacterium]
MKTKLLITLIFSFVILQMSAQDSYIKNRWNIKLAYQTKISNNPGALTYPYYHLGVHYGIIENMELGVNAAYSFSGLGHNSSLKYNVNCNFQILPFFIKADDFRFDFYLTAKGGVATTFIREYTLHMNGTTEIVPAHRVHNLYYAFGSGAAFYPFKHVGVYSEFTYEEYNMTKAWFLMYGLSVKF